MRAQELLVDLTRGDQNDSNGSSRLKIGPLLKKEIMGKNIPEFVDTQAL